LNYYYNIVIVAILVTYSLQSALIYYFFGQSKVLQKDICRKTDIECGLTETILNELNEDTKKTKPFFREGSTWLTSSRTFIRVTLYVDFCGGRKTGDPGEEPSKQGREPTQLTGSKTKTRLSHK
jgi:hypothetical protein